MQENILKFFDTISTPFWDKFFIYVTMLGEQYFAIFVISWIFWNYSKKEGIILSYIFLFSTLINFFAKDIARTKRPFDIIKGLNSQRVNTAIGYSFPSGHTQGASTLFISLGLIFKNRNTMVVAVLLSLLVGFSRIYLRVHWPVDVLGGFILALIISLLFYPILVKIYESKSKFFRFLLLSLAFYYLVLVILIVFNHFFPERAVELNSYIILTSLSTGIFPGYIIQEKYFPFSTEALLWKKFLRFAIGNIGAVGLLVFLKLILPNSLIFTSIGFFLIGIWIVCLFPLLGIWLGLFKRQA
jgi:membrane-associated phospholipid phosphatase